MLVKVNPAKNKVLKVYEREHYFDIGDYAILPKEQRNILRGLFERQIFGRENSEDINKEELKKEYTRTIDEIIKLLQDPRLKEKGKITTCAYSEGGSVNQGLTNGAKVQYIVMDVNGIAILEPLGQANNSSFISEKSEEFADIAHQYGRKEVVEKGLLHKVIHESNKGKSGQYKFEADHILRLLKMAIEGKDDLIAALNAIKSSGRDFGNIATLEAKYSAIRLTREHGLTKNEVIEQAQTIGQEVVQAQGGNEYGR